MADTKRRLAIGDEISVTRASRSTGSHAPQNSLQGGALRPARGEFSLVQDVAWLMKRHHISGTNSLWDRS